MEESMVETRSVSKILVHESFSEPVQYDNDIALLRLDKRLKFRVDVAPICMPPSGDQFTGGLGRVTGWGHTKEGGPTSMELLETHVAVMANSACHNYPGYSADKVTSNMMCAGVMGGGRDTCQGDSGGSLIIEDWQERMFQAGIVSWGIGCARPNRPGVYTRVNAYLPWIIKHTREACYCY
ncbi:trypsin-1-like [Macrosteles quadrilineatus]|uniref:trypsin-1-like n=1 Tax=Macrosteles quadrilineatus TaxID=74068 RepID=UPI0023E0D7B6|nr:trypsin-1-like [Macrosteles quadrilineatus]